VEAFLPSWLNVHAAFLLPADGEGLVVEELGVFEMTDPEWNFRLYGQASFLELLWVE
jgi:hypothetical protein